MLEPMEELDYLDQTRLLAMDHPRGFEVCPNERFLSAPPFPLFKVIASQAARPPTGAWDDQGHDLLPLLLAIAIGSTSQTSPMRLMRDSPDAYDRPRSRPVGSWSGRFA